MYIIPNIFSSSLLLLIRYPLLTLIYSPPHYFTTITTRICRVNVHKKKKSNSEYIVPSVKPTKKQCASWKSHMSYTTVQL